MSVVQLEEMLETCILRQEAGDGLEEIMTSYPDQAVELYALVTITENTRQLAAEINIPQAAQNRSRAQFLSAAVAWQPVPRQPRFTLFHLRLATSAIIGIGILAVILFGTGLASAASLPGDVFYPVKLMVEQMQINLVQDPPARLELQETYDNRRQQEAEQLSEMNRHQQVTFGGFLEQTSDNRWQVGNVTLAFPADFKRPTGLVGAYVQVTGFSDDNEVVVEVIQPRQLEWNGILQKFSDQVWLIGGVTLEVNAETHVSGNQPQVGSSVQVTAIRQSENQYLALNLNVAGGPAIIRESDLESPLARTPSQFKIVATASQEGIEVTTGSQPPGQPVQAVENTAAVPTQNTATQRNTAVVTKTASNRGGSDQEDVKNTSTPVPLATVSNSDGPSASPTPTVRPSPTQKPTEKKSATRTPVFED